MEVLGFVYLEETIEDKERNIYIAFGELDGYRVELVSPINSNSPVDAHISKIGPTPYHILLQKFKYQG